MIRRASIAFAVLSIVFVVALNLTPIVSTDYFMHMAVAEVTWENKAVPGTILFPFTEAKDFEFVAHEWLSGLALYGLTELFGFSGMVVIKALLALVIYALVVWLAMQISSNWPVSAAIGCIVLLTINFRLAIRPEIFSYIFLLTSLNLIQAFLRTERPVWLAGLIPVTLLWANSHGSFVVGIALPPAFLTGIILNDLVRKRLFDKTQRTERLRTLYLPLVAISVLGLGACLLNPLGLKLVTHSLSMGQNASYRDLIAEWFPTFSPMIMSMQFYRVYLIYLAITVIALIIGLPKLDFTLLILLIAFGYLSVVSNRHIGVFAIVGTYWLARGFGDCWREGREKFLFSIAGSLILMGGIAVLLTSGNLQGNRPGFTIKTRLPQSAIETIRNTGIQGNVINSYPFGGPLTYYFYPEIRIGLDSRLDAYGNRYYWEYIYRLNGDVTELIGYMDQNEVVALVLKHADFYTGDERFMIDKFAKLRMAGFEKIYDEDNVIILVRSED
jgi:hypothetical protein